MWGIKSKAGFTLVELLLVVALVAIFSGIAVQSYLGSQQRGRDGRRQTELETIRAALELYRSNVGSYPVGTGIPSTVLSTLVTNGYISSIPNDPVAGRRYYYSAAAPGSTYQLCTAFERVPNPVQACGGAAGCGVACNYRTTNP